MASCTDDGTKYWFAGVTVNYITTAVEYADLSNVDI
jgi:hypothetical protein